MVHIKTDRPRFVADRDDRSVSITLGNFTSSVQFSLNSKQSIATLAADTATHVSDGSALDLALVAKMETFAENESLAVITTSPAGDITLEGFGT